MTDTFKQQIQAEARQAVEELLEQAKLKKGDVFVVGGRIFCQYGFPCPEWKKRCQRRSP